MNKLAKYKVCGEVNTSISGKLLFLLLMDITDENNTVIIPQRRISESLRITKSTVSRNLHRLRDAGYVEIVTRYNDYGGRAPNMYILK
jgi:DNA-binding MarR family transcriptional regulator